MKLFIGIRNVLIPAILMWALLFFAIQVFGSERIIYIAENNVEYTASKTLTDTTGATIEVWDEQHKESYGQDNIDKQLTAAQTGLKIAEVELTTAQDIDPDTAKQDLIDTAQARVDRFQTEIDKHSAIQTVMDSKLIEAITIK